jgi:tRNA threonylcarbamoyladenosine biosynthesis protein TsaE
MEEARFTIESESETQRFGEKVAAALCPGDVVGLMGDLGAGKTTLAGFVAHGLGVPEDTAVTSPTFVLINEYRGRMPVYHIDLYRLSSPEELYDLGIWEYYGGQGVCLVEWCDRFKDLWPEDALMIRIDLAEGEKRRITLSGVGRGRELIDILSRPSGIGHAFVP